MVERRDKADHHDKTRFSFRGHYKLSDMNNQESKLRFVLPFDGFNKKQPPVPVSPGIQCFDPETCFYKHSFHFKM